MFMLLFASFLSNKTLKPFAAIPKIASHITKSLCISLTSVKRLMASYPKKTPITIRDAALKKAAIISARFKLKIKELLWAQNGLLL